MSAFHWPWPVLEIAPTDDRKTIREAYSRLLKALDPDAETEAFMALRDARDAALSGQFLHPPRDDGEEEDDFGLGTPLPESEDQPVGGIEPLTNAEPAEKPVFTVEYSEADDKRFNRTVELFLGEGELTQGEIAELHEHLDALLSDDRMADLGHYARVEAWLAQLLAERYPRGAALFPRIAEHFQWSERAHELGIHPAIPWLFNAHEGQSLVRELSTPGHKYHREWAELTRGKPQGMLWLRAIDKPRMANLIATVRRDYPWLEQEHWQPDLVARWEKKVAGGTTSGPNQWVWIIFVVLFLSAIGRMIGSEGAATSGPETPSKLAATVAAEANVLDFIQTEFPQAAGDGRTIVTLRKQSPRAYEKLAEVAGRYGAPGDARDRLMTREIDEIYFYIIDKLPYKMQVADAKFRAATLKDLQGDAPSCTAFFKNPRSYLRQGRNSDALSPEYRYHMFSVLHDEYGDREWPLVDKTMTIPGEVVGKLIKRSGLSEERLRAAITTDAAPDADVCAAMRSLYEITTEIPEAQANKILPAIM